MKYLSGVACPEAIELGVGLMATPLTYGPKKPPEYPYWAFDNACFAHPIEPGNKNESRWLRKMDRMPKDALFAVCPDMAYHEGSRSSDPAQATLDLFHRYRNEVTTRGFKVAFALQNGSEAPGMVPWEEIDAVFIGGDTPWKLSHHAMYLVWEAKSRGLWTHMGRANSRKRFRRAVEMQVDSTDGNFLKWPTTNKERLRVMLHGLNDDPQLALA